MTEHTPLPFAKKFHQNLMYGVKMWYIKQPTDDLSGIAVSTNNEADIDFIVHACNEHDNLIKQVKTLSANLQVLINVIKDPNGGSDLAKSMIILVAMDTLDDAKETLSKAKATQ